MQRYIKKRWLVMAIPPILVLAGAGVFALIALGSSLLTPIGTILDNGIGAVFALAGIPFMPIATLGDLLGIIFKGLGLI
jgi:hypothetical protein